MLNEKLTIEAKGGGSSVDVEITHLRRPRRGDGIRRGVSPRPA
jgi:hypothetical protein